MRSRILTGLIVTVVVVLAALWFSDTLRIPTEGPSLANGAESIKTNGASHHTTGAAEQPEHRAINPLQPMRLWIGGDSLAGALGPSLGEMTAATGVVQPQYDSRVGSGLISGDIDWPVHAQQQLTVLKPEVAVFIIGTNDANVYDDSLAAEYEMKTEQMMRILAGSGREVYWVNAPVMRDEHLEANVLKVNKIQAEAAAKVPGVTLIDAHTLFADETGAYQSYLPDATGKKVLDARRRRHPPHRGRGRPPGQRHLQQDRAGLEDGRAGGAEPAEAGARDQGLDPSGRGQRLLRELLVRFQLRLQRLEQPLVQLGKRVERHDRHDAGHRPGRLTTTVDDGHDRGIDPVDHRGQHSQPVAAASSSVGSRRMSGEPLPAAVAAVETTEALVQAAALSLAERATVDGRISVSALDEHQVVAYDLADAASAVAGCRVMLDYSRARRARSLAGVHLHRRRRSRTSSARLIAREDEWGVEPGQLASTLDFLVRYRDPAFLETVADALPESGTGPAHLDDDFDLVRDTLPPVRGGQDQPGRRAHPPRRTTTSPRTIIEGHGRDRRVRPVGARGVRRVRGRRRVGLPRRWCVATEELSWGSLGAGGALITRPEILTRGIVKGGTEEQKQEWLPQIATGERVVGVMVTEPDFGSDVAGVKVTATPTDGGYLLNGVKTWCTFAGRADTLMVLARTDPDRSLGHRGLSVFVVDKPPAPGHHFEFDDGRGGKMEGRAIDTLGYRGMHSYEVAFDNWFVPAENLVGARGWAGQGLLPPDGGLRERAAPDRGRAPSA